MKHLLITGVSTGIGYGTAKAFASHGYHVFGSVRRPADALRVQTEMVRQVFETKRPKTRYALVPNKFATWSIPSPLPDRWLDWLLARFG